MERSPLLAVAALAVAAGALSRLVTHLPPLLLGGGATVESVAPVLVAASFLQLLVSPLGAVAVGYAYAGRLDVRDRLAATSLAVAAVGFLGLVAGAAVGLSVLPERVGVAGSLVPLLLNGLAVGATGAVTLTVAVVAGAAVGTLRARPA